MNTADGVEIKIDETYWILKPYGPVQIVVGWFEYPPFVLVNDDEEPPYIIHKKGNDSLWEGFQPDELYKDHNKLIDERIKFWTDMKN